MSRTTRAPRPHVAAFALLIVSLTTAASVEGQWTNRYPKLQGYSHHVYLEGYELPALTNGPIDPAVSPDGRSIAFSSRGWIWVMGLETGHAVRVTSGRDMDSRPTWSPDGTTLAFVRDNDHETAIVVIDADTGAERLVIDSPALELDPAFSADGAELYFSSGREGTLDLWVHDLTEGIVRRVTDAPGIELRPQPGGDQLVYLAKQGGDRIVRRTVAADGTEVETALQQGSITSMTRPALSPDGTIVAYNWPTQSGWELRLMRVDAPGPTILLVGDGLPLTPAWSPDGEWVYFAAADERERFGLKRVRRAGGPVQ
ncbi:MAG: LpqB family beta-propeller domain-containing protein, partial [Gemmatimonadota bacterium]|nr:LpqB family beta-propeller domain-containing protein [Gemmatimonadota bacterium]